MKKKCELAPKEKHEYENIDVVWREETHSLSVCLFCGLDSDAIEYSQVPDLEMQYPIDQLAEAI